LRSSGLEASDVFEDWRLTTGSCPQLYRHPGEGRDLTLSVCRTGEIPACAGMTEKGRPGIHPEAAVIDPPEKPLSYLGVPCQPARVRVTVRVGFPSTASPVLKRQRRQIRRIRPYILSL
jgi:hypothetical protein